MKRAIINWATENRTLAYVLAGAIGLPLALGATVGVLVFFTWLLSFVFGTAMAMLVLFFMLLGGLIGFLVAGSKAKEHGDYY